MTVPLATQQVCRLEMRHSMHGNAMYNVLHMIRDDIFDPLVLEAAAVDFASAWNQWVMPTMSAEVSLPEVAIQQVWPTVGVHIVVPTSHVGQVAGDAVANQCALILSLTSLDPGRRARGRLFIGGYPEANFDGANGIWPTAFANQRANNLITWQNSAEVDGAGWEQIIWSTASVVGPSPQYYAIVNVIGRTVPASLRSRRLGRGI